MTNSLGASGAPESSIMVLVRAVESLVGPWRELYDPRAPLGVPAHITLLYPFLPPDQITHEVVDELRQLFSAFEPFPFRLTRAGRFPGVLYLAPEPVEPFLMMSLAVATRWPEAPPYGGRYPSTVPHLTVAHLADDARVDELERVITPALPIDTTAASAWLLVQDNNGQWWFRSRLALGAG